MAMSLEPQLAYHQCSGAVYITPTSQNPTTRVMSLKRRRELVRICRLRSIPIIEDDVYRLKKDISLPQIALLAPDITIYVNSLSKILNPALRIGGLLVPEALFPQAELMLRATAMMVSPLSCAIMEQWLIDGTVGAVTDAIEEETTRRYEMTLKILGDHMHHSGRPSFHIWIPLTREHSLSLYDAAMAAGVRITSPSSTEVAILPEQSGVRLCIGAPGVEELIRALLLIKSLIEQLKSPALPDTTV